MVQFSYTLGLLLEGGVHIAEALDIVVSIIDNLLKGASGQAVQNMNLMLGFPETSGLSQVPMFP